MSLAIMKIVIKVLQGEELTIEVKSDSKVLELKEQVGQLLNTPASHLKLLLTGRPLKDENCLGDYPSIKDGTKLNVIVNQISTPKKRKEKAEEQDLSILRDAAYKFLREFYTESETQRIVEEFGKEFLRSVSILSLDDYERIAISCLQEDGAS